MIVRISALREGFRRCGIAHSVQPVDHPADRFSEAELARLLDEPLLKVQLLDMGEAGHSVASFCAQLVDEPQPASEAAANEAEQLPADPAQADKVDAKASAKAPAKAGK